MRFTADGFPMRFRIIFFVIIYGYQAHGQPNLLDDQTALEVVKKGIFYIYNTETRKAEQYIHLVEELIPGHPVAPMMRALNTNWSSNPIKPGTEEYRKLIGYLQISMDRAKVYLKQDPDNMEAIFFGMAIHSWLAQFYDEDGQTFKALSAAKKAYQYMKLGFNLLDKSPEFYFSTGLYNYYRVQYPESNPVYKPFVWFFREGNKELGLQQLDHASNVAVFTRAEAAMYLAHIYLRYENKPQYAVDYSRELVKAYPKNTFFKVNHTEALLAAEQYERANAIIEQLVIDKKDFYRMSGEIFHGIYLEKYRFDLVQAKKRYLEALTIGKPLGTRAENKKSLAHAGLARIAASNGDMEEARAQYKIAIKLAQYDEVRKEAKSYLRSH